MGESIGSSVLLSTLILLPGCGTPAECEEVSWTLDLDGDGYAGDSVQLSCERPLTAAEAVGDCDDANSDVHPSAEDDCDGVDNDCDGVTDPDAETWYLDADGDGYGDSDRPVSVCGTRDGAVPNAEDCDDADDSAHPGATEVWYDGIDQDCAGDDDFDQDGDGFQSDTHGGDDCGDADAAVHPDAEEECNDGIDNDCDSSTLCERSGMVVADEMDGAFTDDDPETDYYGHVLAFVGDPDGDGDAEFAFAYRRAVDLDGDGRAWEELIGTRLLGQDAAGEASVDFLHETALEHNSHHPQSGPADYDVDGYDDLLIYRTPEDDGSSQDHGLYVYSGPVGAGTEPAHWSFRIVGSDQYIRPGERTGLGRGPSGAVLAAADSSAFAPHGGGAVGAVFSFELGTPESDTVLTDAATAVIWGRDTYERMGESVMWADLDGDGIDELVVGRGGTLDYGRDLEPGIGVFRGPLSGWISFKDHDHLLQDAESRADTDRRGLGFEGGAALDANGDGLDELFFGHGWYDDGDGQRGRAFLFDPATWTDSQVTTDDASLTLIMDRGMYGSGFPVAAADINCDGADDLLAAEADDETLEGQGQVYALYAPIPTGTIAATDADVTWFSPGEGDEFGSYLAAGDINGDGCDDVAITAIGYPRGLTEGAVYLGLGLGL